METLRRKTSRINLYAILSGLHTSSKIWNRQAENALVDPHHVRSDNSRQGAGANGTACLRSQSTLARQTLRCEEAGDFRRRVRRYHGASSSCLLGLPVLRKEPRCTRCSLSSAVERIPNAK